MNDTNDTCWFQLTLNCTDWQAAESMAVTHLHPLLSGAATTGWVTGYWYVRKGPLWRVRLRSQPGPQHIPRTVLDRITGTLLGERAIVSYCDNVYEPETLRFGGATAMDTAHELFMADSRHVLRYLATSGANARKEVAVRLATRFMNAAGLDFYEHGDVWQQVADHRSTTAAGPGPVTTAAVQQLLTAASDAPASPLTTTPQWPTAFEHAGRALGALASQGALSRGLRAILTDHLLFHFNRLGISAAHQHLLATAAARVVFHRDTTNGAPAHHLLPPAARTTLDAVTTDTAARHDHADLRQRLVEHIDRLGTFRTPHVKCAFSTVPRHLFLPGVQPTEAYGTRGAVVTKRADDGTALSSASSPNIVAAMLEQLQAQPGHRVLEIGAATGINAALLAELVGPTGTVVTIELDDDLAAGAHSSLTAAGYPHVTVICGDGALGHASAAPYDRIEATAGAWDIAEAWWRQLAVGGRIVLPLRLHGSGLTRSLALDLIEPTRMISTSAVVCGFVPMRGTTEHREHHIRLAEDVILKVDTDDIPEEAALATALCHPAHRRWTGIHIRHDEPAEHLDLWLATHGDAAFAVLAAGRTARDTGLVNPAIRWAGAALYDGGTLTYLTTRSHNNETDELGITTHGPDSTRLADRTTDLLALWASTRPIQPEVTAYANGHSPDPELPGTPIVRPATTLTINW